MGGFGSSRWRSYRKKRVVEDCLCLDINALVRCGIVRHGAPCSGKWGLARGCQGPAGTIGYEISIQAGELGSMRLLYTFAHIQRDLSYEITLARTLQPLGGERWWFRCPMWIGERLCDSRVAKLYLPPSHNDLFFGCRTCHQLTYRSSQTAYSPSARLASAIRLPTLGERMESIRSSHPDWLDNKHDDLHLRSRHKNLDLGPQ